MPAECERCSAVVSVRFACLGRRLCFTCLEAVFQLTSGYESLRAIATQEMDEAMIEINRRKRSHEVR
jgi:hypothetical protein